MYAFTPIKLYYMLFMEICQMKKLNVLKVTLMQTNVPMASFILFTLYSMIAGFSIGSAIASFSFASLYGYKIFLDSKNQDENVNNVLERMNRIESNVSALKMSQGFKVQTINEQRK